MKYDMHGVKVRWHPEKGANYGGWFVVVYDESNTEHWMSPPQLLQHSTALKAMAEGKMNGVRE